MKVNEGWLGAVRLQGLLSSAALAPFGKTALDRVS
jgi:hypothetical protein